MAKKILNVLKYLLLFGIGAFIFWKIYKGEWGKVKEALKNIKEAILLYLEPVADDLNYSPDSEIVEITL